MPHPTRILPFRQRGASVACLAMAIAASAAVAPARAETQISAYGGANWNLSSRVTTTGPNPDSRDMDWAGKPFEMPPYWGARGTYWFGEGPAWGLALDYAHAKAYGKLGGTPYSTLEFTDGLNLLTLNLLYRFNPLMDGALVPYAGIGVGASIPHVEVQINASPKTFEYQLAGVSAQALAGLEYRLGKSWSVFTEAKLSYAQIDADLVGGGSLSTDIWSPQVAIGVTYHFGGN